MSRRFGRRGGPRVLLWLLVVATACCAIAYALETMARPRRLVDTLDVRYAVIDVLSGRFRVAPALAAAGAEPFPVMVGRLKPYAAITGTYYDERRTVLGDVVIDGKVVKRGGQRQGIGFTSDGRIVFRERKPNTRIDWRGCSSGIACGPRLIRAGKTDVDVVRDGFGSAAARKEATRCAVGATARGRLIMCVVAEPVTLDTLAKVMLELGARDAINLDGGSMCALYAEGEYRAKPVSDMSSILAVYKRK